jgi:DNA-binding transcriptional LysR family regulator
MKLDQLDALVKVVQAGSFTAAAAVLGTDKARLSRTVSALERELGTRLLERSTRALRLTESGRSVHERALAILGATDDLLQFTRALQTEPQGTLRLTCSVDFALVAANLWITGYLQRWPRVSVAVDFSARRVDLVHEGIDLALRLGPLDDSRLAARELGRLHYGLYASPEYLRREGRPQDIDGLRRHALLLFSTGSGRTDWTLLPAGGGAAEHIRGPGRVRSSSITLLLQACLAGLGIARLPLQLAACQPAGRLQPVLPGWTPQTAVVSAVFPSNRFLSPKVRAFIDHAAAELEATTPTRLRAR